MCCYIMQPYLFWQISANIFLFMYTCIDNIKQICKWCYYIFLIKPYTKLWYLLILNPLHNIIFLHWGFCYKIIFVLIFYLVLFVDIQILTVFVIDNFASFLCLPHLYTKNGDPHAITPPPNCFCRCWLVCWSVYMHIKLF